MSHKHAIGFLVTLLTYLYCVGCRNTPQISYQHDVRPILEDKCVDCHIPPNAKGYNKTGLSMENYQTLMDGSVYGPVIVPGDSKRSPLNILVEGRAGNLTRELKSQHKEITDNEVRILRLWVEQGARNN